MKRAIKLPQYSDMKPFSAPSGVQMVRVDKNTWLPADETCPQDYSIAFLSGTVPSSTCSHMGQTPQSVLQGMFPNGTPNPNAVPAPAAQPQPAATPTTRPSPVKKKRNIFQKIFGGGKRDSQPAEPPPSTPPQ